MGNTHVQASRKLNVGMECQGDGQVRTDASTRVKTSPTHLGRLSSSKYRSINSWWVASGLIVKLLYSVLPFCVLSMCQQNAVCGFACIGDRGLAPSLACRKC